MAGFVQKAFSEKYRSDTAGVAIDVLVVALTVGAALSGAGILAELAFLGGCALVATDGWAYGTEILGNDERAESIKQRTETLRIIATIATLPDALWGGYKIIREMMEIRELRAGSFATAARADSDAARAARMTQTDRARRYAEIGERARARAAGRAAKLRQLWIHEVPRGQPCPCL